MLSIGLLKDRQSESFSLAAYGSRYRTRCKRERRRSSNSADLYEKRHQVHVLEDRII
jgi:hypothetical protein